MTEHKVHFGSKIVAKGPITTTPRKLVAAEPESLAREGRRECSDTTSGSRDIQYPSGLEVDPVVRTAISSDRMRQGTSQE